MRRPFDYVPVNEKRERIEPLRDGVPVGTIRTTGAESGFTHDIACEHCGDLQARSEWQANNSFHCWECGQLNTEVKNRRRASEFGL